MVKNLIRLDDSLTNDSLYLYIRSHQSKAVLAFQTTSPFAAPNPKSTVSRKMTCCGLTFLSRSEDFCAVVVLLVAVMSSFGTRRSTTKVYLNVYDLAPVNECLHPIGLGIYHTGVEVLGSEYTFASQAGVFHHSPKEVPQATFREQLYMGEFNGGHAELKTVVAALSDERFGPSDYDILRRNCNHFADAFCRKLVLKSNPGYINRIADIADWFRCLIPKQMLSSAPVDKQSDEANSFLVKAPINRGAPPQGSAGPMAFSGSGSVLGGGSSAVSHNDSLTDRREKARAAALARLEIQQRNDSDKSM
jgi:deubiquitinase DESI2